MVPILFIEFSLDSILWINFTVDLPKELNERPLIFIFILYNLYEIKINN